MTRKKATQKEITAQDFINVDEIDEDLLYTKDGYIMAYISVRGRTETLMSDREKEQYFLQITAALDGEREPWQLLSIPRTVDIEGIVDNLTELREKARQDAKKKNRDNSNKIELINEELQTMQEMAQDGVKEPMLIFKVYTRERKGAKLELQKRVRELTGNLSKAKIEAKQLTEKDIVFICKMFSDLTSHQISEEELIGTVPVLKGRKARFDEKDSFLNSITPIGGIEFKSDRINMGSAVGKVYAVVKYPKELQPGWAVSLMNSPDCITAITFYPSPQGALAEALSKSIIKAEREAVNENDPRTRKQFIRQAEDADELISKLDDDREQIGAMTILVMPICENDEQLRDCCKRVENRFAAKKMKLKTLGNIQKEGLQSLSPYHIPHLFVEDIAKQIVPLYTVAGGSPMTINQFKDDNGYYFAKTMDGGMVILNLDKREGDRVNPNIVIVGGSGGGKSTVIKHIIETEVCKGTKILAIDPERELKELCRNFGGMWLDMGGGAAMVNPLQVRPVPHDDDEEENPYFKSSDNAFASHLKSLDAFLGLYISDLTSIQMAALKRLILDLYKKFGITFETDITSFGSEDFPTFKDLYELCKSKMDENELYKDFEMLLHDIAYGGDSFLWNGHTNIDTNSQFICFDTNSLNSSGDKIKRAQYYNILTLCWELMSKDRTEKVLLVCDEAYLLVDPNTPQALIYLRNIMKRCRKYEGALAVVTQAIKDFLHNAVKLYGQDLLNIPTYKIFMGMDGTDLEDLSDTYNLTEAEQAILNAKIKGEGLAMIGSQRIHVYFYLSKKRLELMGTAGGR